MPVVDVNLQQPMSHIKYPIAHWSEKFLARLAPHASLAEEPPERSSAFNTVTYYLLDSFLAQVCFRTRSHAYHTFHSSATFCWSEQKLRSLGMGTSGLRSICIVRNACMEYLDTPAHLRTFYRCSSSQTMPISNPQ